MKKIFIVGAGLSSSSLIAYMLENSKKYKWEILLGDLDVELARKKIGNHSNAVYFNVFDEKQRDEMVSQADIVISLLPPSLHPLILETCYKYAKNIITASYLSDDLRKRNQEFIDKGMTVLFECGLDPGIDHMSAMQIIDSIRNKGGKMLSFKSSTGGLVAPDHDDNPWNYKFTWNPQNVVLAGKAGAQFREDGKMKLIPYNRLFKRAERILVDENSDFETYPNRDSLKYISVYDLHDIETIYRGTIRRSGFCKSWSQLIELGLTEDTFNIGNSDTLTYRQLTQSFLPSATAKNTEELVAELLRIDIDSKEMNKLRWLGIFDERKIEMKDATPAKALQKLLEEKLALRPEEKDMIVMQHEFTYKNKNNDINTIISTLVIEGQDKDHTAMAMTVGLPLGIAAKLLLTGKIEKKGIVIPVTKEFYEPILAELEEYSIKFSQKEVMIQKGR